MKQMRWQNVQKINLYKSLEAANAVSELEKRKWEDNIMENVKKKFRLKKDIDSSKTENERYLLD